MVTATKKLTYLDYLDTPDDIRYELIDGELVLMPSPNAIHQRILKKLVWWFMQIEDAGLGTAWFAPFDVFLSETSIFQPDLLFISNERAYITTDDNVQGSPDLVIEIISPSDPRRDTVRKRAIYERYRVGEFWLVDPYARNITVLTLGNHGYETAGIYGEGDTLTSPTLPGFALNVSDLF